MYGVWTGVFIHINAGGNVNATKLYLLKGEHTQRISQKDIEREEVRSRESTREGKTPPPREKVDLLCFWPQRSRFGDLGGSLGPVYITKESGLGYL
jgi:hypothetical protein